MRSAADELGYVPLEAARQLRVRRSGLLGMTVINIANPFFADLMAGAEDAVAAAGLRVLVGNSDDDVTKERDHLELFERVQVEGALVLPFGDTGPWIDRLRARGIPVVLVDTMDDAGVLPSVSLDDIAGGRMAAGHLIDIGRRRLAFLGAREEVRQVRERLQGAREAVAEHPEVGLEVTWCERTTARVGSSSGRASPRWMPRTGLTASSPRTTTWGAASCTASSAGVRVPEDIAVIGYDDIEFASIAAVPLSSIRQPAPDMGRQAGELLLRQIAGDSEPLGSVDVRARARGPRVERARGLKSLATTAPNRSARRRYDIGMAQKAFTHPRWPLRAAACHAGQAQPEMMTPMAEFELTFWSDAVTATVDDSEIGTYVFAPDAAASESPKPYWHPLRALDGGLVTGYRPWDHRWHKGLQMTWTHLSGQNFWGGPTYVHGEGYVMRDNAGRMRHESFSDVRDRGDEVGFTETLTWIASDGEEWVAEERTHRLHGLDLDRGIWIMDFATTHAQHPRRRPRVRQPDHPGSRACRLHRPVPPHAEGLDRRPRPLGRSAPRMPTR